MVPIVTAGGKYKNICSAMHNFGDSFLSLMNCVNKGYVVDDLHDIHSRGLDIENDWLGNSFTPHSELTPRIEHSMSQYRDNLKVHLQSQQVTLGMIQSLKFLWPAGGRRYMCALDDRGKEHTIYVAEIK